MKDRSRSSMKTRRAWAMMKATIPAAVITMMISNLPGGTPMLPNETFTPLTIPVPPDPLLEQALGYTGQARFFATWWEPCGDEAMVSDGRTTATGEWQGFLAYVQHPIIYPALYRVDLGSSETEAKAWLGIDRQERKACIAKPKDARAFLAQQWPQSA